MKKPAGSVRFYKQKTKKTEPNQNRQKTGKKNRAKPEKPKKPSQNRKKPSQSVWTGFFPKKPNRTETGRFDPVSVRFRFFSKKKISIWLFFLIKTEPNKKWSPLVWFSIHEQNKNEFKIMLTTFRAELIMCFLSYLKMWLPLFFKLFFTWKYIKIIFFIFKKLFLILAY